MVCENRDNFTVKTKELLAKRVGYRCSNPACRVSTIGPNSNSGKSMLKGDACHICAASPGGARYDASMSHEARKSYHNGLWLCKNCAWMIDHDEKFTVELLRDWKRNAESLAEQENGRNFSREPAETVVRKPRHYLRNALLIGLFFSAVILFFAELVIAKATVALWPRILCAVALIMGGVWFLDAIETRPEIARACFGTLKENQLYDSPKMIHTYLSEAFGRVVELPGDVPEGFHTYYRFRRIEFGSWGQYKMNFMRVQFARCLEWYDPSVLYLHTLSKGGQAIKMLIRQGFVLERCPFAEITECDYLVKDSLHVFLSYETSGILKIKRLRQAEIFNCSNTEMNEYWKVVHNDLGKSEKR